MAERRVRGIIFDLDGTLIDSYAAITESLNHARAHYGLAALDAEFVRLRVGRGLECLVAELVGDDRVDNGVALFRQRYSEVYLDVTQPLTGAAESLERLHRSGYRLAVASNKPARFSKPILEHLSMGAYLSCVAGPDTVGVTKPDPRMLNHCMSQLGLAAGETLYVGDMLLDIRSADQAAVDVVLVCGGSATREELQGAKRPVLDSIADLPDWLRDSG